jgi:prophage tail gpP-like protein
MANASETVALTVAGQKYTGWTSVMVRRVYGGACSDFQLSVAQPIDTGATNFSSWKIKNNDQCTITLGGVLAFTGYVFVRQTAFDAKQHGLMVTGRSLTADAVDSSAPVNGGQYKGYTFQALRGLHITDDAKGNWIAEIFDPKAKNQGQLVEGKNLLKCRATIDSSRSFNIVNIVSQRPGNDQTNGTPSRDVSATLTNSSVRPARRLIMVMEQTGSPQDAVIRANHETSYNATDIVDCHAEAQGFFAAPGQLWDSGQNYAVNSPMADLDRTLASRQVIYRQSSETGTITEIDLCTPESLAFSSTPIGGSVLQGEPAYASDTPSQGATPDQPDNLQ